MYISVNIIVFLCQISAAQFYAFVCVLLFHREWERGGRRECFLTITSVLQLNHQRHWIHLECSRWFHIHKAWRTFPQQRVLRRPYCYTPRLLSTLLAETQILPLKSKFHISYNTTTVLLQYMMTFMHQFMNLSNFFIIMLSYCQNVMSFTYKIIKLRYFLNYHVKLFN